MKVFVSCVSQKHGDNIANIANIKEDSLSSTFDKWKSLTQGGNPSKDVYKGIQWEIVKQINDIVPTYVISAGYGIISMNDPIVNYSITLSPAYIENRHLLIPTFGLSQKQANKEWFNKFGDYSHYWDTDETIIITVNPDYLDVLDIPKKDNIIILNNYKLGELAKWLKTGVNSLASSFTLYLTRNYPNLTGNKELKHILNSLILEHGQQLYPKRKKVTDKFVINWITEGKSLRLLRDSGHGCSVQRFNKLKNLVTSK